MRLATLGAGEHFSEVALMKDLPRNASVKALEPTDVLAIGRGDVAAFSQNLTLLKASLQESLAKRAAEDEAPPSRAVSA